MSRGSSYLSAELSCAWAATATVGLVIVAFGVIAIVDPVGTKSADESDPFGTPPSRWTSSVVTLFGLALVLWPVPILVRRARSGPEDSHGGSG